MTKAEKKMTLVFRPPGGHLIPMLLSLERIKYSRKRHRAQYGNLRIFLIINSKKELEK
jgi:hypothetical protein